MFKESIVILGTTTFDMRSLLMIFSVLIVWVVCWSDGLITARLRINLTILMITIVWIMVICIVTIWTTSLRVASFRMTCLLIINPIYSIRLASFRMTCLLIISPIDSISVASFWMTCLISNWSNHLRVTCLLITDPIDSVRTSCMNSLWVELSVNRGINIVNSMILNTISLIWTIISCISLSYRAWSIDICSILIWSSILMNGLLACTNIILLVMNFLWFISLNMNWSNIVWAIGVGHWDVVQIDRLPG